MNNTDDKHYTELLANLDDASNVLCPLGFDRSRAEAKAEELATGLRGQLPCRLVLETGQQVHDTTFNAELHLFNVGSNQPCATIRLSNFGNMATIINEEKLPRETVAIVLRVLREFAYVFIPASVLGQPYTGRLTHVDTWTSRFFHYL